MDCIFLHNPFAKYPLPKETLSHPRVAAQGYVESDGYVNFVAPEDFLLLRFYNHSISKISKYGHIYLLYIDKV